jgi:hypothetical protein
MHTEGNAKGSNPFYSKPSAKAPVIDPGDEAPFLVPARGGGTLLSALILVITQN